MIKSMTAYGRSLRLSSLGKWLIEIHSVNRKSLDFNVLMPKDLLQFDIEIRRWVAPFMKRGHVTVKVYLHSNEEVFDLAERIPYLRSMKEEMHKACSSLGFPLEEITFPFLYEEAKVASSLTVLKDEDLVRHEIKLGVEEALAACIKMKEAEGFSLREAFFRHLANIEVFLREIESRALGVEERYHKKTLDKLQEFKEVSLEDKERILREVFLYVEKADVAEEITRMYSHIKQFEKILHTEEGSVGRTMDFLIQEMGREVNTIASKSDDLDMSYSALKMKGEIEKIREQAQNIE